MMQEPTAVGLPTRDPFTGSPLVVTRLESPSTGNAFEGRFGLGWIGRLTNEQIDFVGLLLMRRNNLQKLAADLDIAYNTARGRFEDIVDAIGGSSGDESRSSLRAVLQRLAAGEISAQEADRELKG